MLAFAGFVVQALVITCSAVRSLQRLPSAA